jgi:hypothetical protein
MDFDQAKRRQIKAEATYRTYGFPLEFESGVTERQQWRPIRPCLCVWDSPQSPCSCGNKTIWWLSAESIVDEGSAGRKSHEEEELLFFDVLLDSNIMVESVDSVSVRALARLGTKISPARIRGLTTAPSGGSGTIALEIDPSVIIDLLVEAYGLLDDAGVFDDVSGLIDQWKKQHGLS